MNDIEFHRKQIKHHQEKLAEAIGDSTISRVLPRRAITLATAADLPASSPIGKKRGRVRGKAVFVRIPQQTWIP